MVDLSVQVGGLRLKNPVIAASGTFGFGSEYGQLYDVSCLGAICTKGLTLRPRRGNPPPRLWETPCGLLNSIGLENPGVEAFVEEELPRMRRLGTRVIANVWGETPEEYGRLAERLSRSEVDAIELNLSCPNVPALWNRYSYSTGPGGKMLGLEPAGTAAAVGEARRACEKPLWVKLPPEGEVSAAARAAQEAGADAISATNTFRAMAIDIRSGRPAFVNRFGGLSGPAIKPISLRVVYELSQILKIPVIGIGGITTWQDAVEFIMAGAHAVQVGTANFIDPLAIPNLIRGLADFPLGRGLKGWEDIRGCAIRG
jgi:dihydroorotate dehydrogenase (NAD+) catalytic subunit